MSKPVHRRGGNTPTDKPKTEETQPASTAPAKIPVDTRSLVERLLDTPHAAQVVRRLQPEVLHRVILTSGLEDAGELVALASPAQLQRVFDFDLWRAPEPGRDEMLDADRFATWLEVLMDQGPAVAAEKLLGMDLDFVATAVAQHVRVFDGAAVAYTTLDGDVITPKRSGREEFSAEIGGFFVAARQARAWDSLRALLQHLDAEHPDGFARLMRRCRQKSNAGFEADALHNLMTGGEQDLFDVAIDREGRLEQAGYATPAQARAFLKMSRQVDLAGGAPPDRNPIASAYFHALAESMSDVPETSPDVGGTPPSSVEEPTIDPTELAASVAAVNDLLSASGVVPPVRALLGAGTIESSRLSRIQSLLRALSERDPDSAAARLAELAFLTNTIAAGGSVQGRSFTVREASDAALATCNLGLEHWPPQWPPPEDCVPVFQVGWTVLHRDVGRFAARQLTAALAEIEIHDREIQLGLQRLRTSLIRHGANGEPWGALAALDVLAILDLPAWMALTALIGECPVVHAALSASLRPGVRSIDPVAFEFISENAQIDQVREFLQMLPERLTN